MPLLEMPKTGTAMQKRPRQEVRKTISGPEFVRIYREVVAEGGTVEEVSKRSGMRRELVYARASEYRSSGVDLGRLRRLNERKGRILTKEEAASYAKRFEAASVLSPERDQVIESLLKMVEKLT